MSFIVKNTTHIGLLDLIAPHSCRGCGCLGAIVCDCCKKNILKQKSYICPNCKQVCTKHHCKKCHLPPIYYVGRREDLLANLIHDYKYNSVRTIKNTLAEALDHALPTIEGPAVIIPLPTISRHVRERGLDHTYLIAKKLARRRGYKVKKLTIRAENTIQVGTDRKTRLKHAKHAYSLANKAKIDKDTTYILFDDVWTTGASMKAALKKLRDAGASKIILLILAVS